MDDKQFDQMLSAALQEANRQDYSEFDTIDDEIPWSANYRRERMRMRANPQRWYRGKTAPVWKRVGRMAALFALVITLSFAALLTLSPEVRANFSSWTLRVFDTNVQYDFLGDETDKLPWFELHEIPEGYEEFIREEHPDSVLHAYESNDAQVFSLQYFKMASGSALSIAIAGAENEPVTVDGWDGHFYSPVNPDASAVLVWMDLDHNLQFVIDGFFDKETLIYYAENIVEKNN